MSVEYLAEAALAGISPSEFIKSDSDTEVDLLTLVANEAIKRRGQHQKELAAQIINFLGKSLGGNKSRGTERGHRGDPSSEGRS